MSLKEQNELLKSKIMIMIEKVIFKNSQKKNLSPGCHTREGTFIKYTFVSRTTVEFDRGPHQTSPEQTGLTLSHTPVNSRVSKLARLGLE